MTSNIGAATISKNQSLGFSVGDDTGLSYDEMKDRIMGELKKVFRPELLNRIDEVIVFHKLTKDEIKIIVDLMMKRLKEQMGEHEAAIELTEEAKELLVTKGYDPAMGARPLRRAIQRFIEDPLADFVLGRSLKPGSTIVVGTKEGEEEVDTPVVEGEGSGRAREGHRPRPTSRRRGGRGRAFRRRVDEFSARNEGAAPKAPSLDRAAGKSISSPASRRGRRRGRCRRRSAVEDFRSLPCRRPLRSDPHQSRRTAGRGPGSR